MEILNKIQKELKAPKGQHNNFGNYNYRSCEDILEAVKPLLEEAVVLLSDEIVMIGDRFYVKATATIKTKGDSVSVTAYARESLDKKGMDVAQITGASSSYARKYALNGLFCIDDTKDADTRDNKGEEVVYIDNKELSQITDEIDDLGVDKKKFLEYLDIQSLELLPKAGFKKAMEALEAKRKAKK